MLTIPAIDILNGNCVRLYQGDYSKVKQYSQNPLKIAQKLQSQRAEYLHIIDLDGAKNGRTSNFKTIIEIANNIDIPIQVGGGIRNFQDAQKYLKAGIDRIILGSSAIQNPQLIKKLINEFGPQRIIIATDIKNNKIAIEGWTKSSNQSISNFLQNLKQLNASQVLVTDISKDGTLEGPNLPLIQKIIKSGFQVFAAGGISNIKDLQNLKSIGVKAAITGKAYYEGRINLSTAKKLNTDLAKRVIPCLDVANGQVVKGINFKNLKVTGDPVELGQKYSEQSADELVFLDITATNQKRQTLVNLVEKVAQNIFIPFTVGGGIKNLDDIQTLLLKGADKIAICTTAIKNPSLIKQASKRFGAQCIVISMDCKKDGKSWKLYTNGGKVKTKVDAIKFAKKMEKLGAGELLINSLDQDGTKQGYDLELLRSISETVNIPIIASSGAGTKEDFTKAYQFADACLAASIFHFDKIQIPELKKYLRKSLTIRP